MLANKVLAAALVAGPNRLFVPGLGPGVLPAAPGNKDPRLFVPVAGPYGVVVFPENNPYGAYGAPVFPNAPVAPLWGAKSDYPVGALF